MLPKGIAASGRSHRKRESRAAKLLPPTSAIANETNFVGGIMSGDSRDGGDRSRAAKLLPPTSAIANETNFVGGIMPGDSRDGGDRSRAAKLLPPTRMKVSNCVIRC